MKKELLLAAMGIASLTPGCVKTGIEELLNNVADTLVPDDVQMGAMCYEVAMPPERTEYVCLTCGKKTIHATGQAGEWWDSPSLCVQQYRTVIHKLNMLGLDVKLDEAFLCSACKKDGTSAFFIEVTYKKRKSRSALSSINDLHKLLACFEEKLAWTDDNGQERPLKPELPRICQLLGLEK